MSLLSWLWPHRCPCCGAVITGQQTECEHCRIQFPTGIYSHYLPDGTICISPFAYDGAIRESILQMKKDGLRTRANSFGQRIGLMIRQTGIAPDIITSVPLYPSDKMKRGFNQSEQIARCTAGICGCPYRELLQKVRKNQVQHHLSAEQRQKNVQGVYAVRHTHMIQGRCILLIDDVCTTGSTLCECVRVLKESGAGKVISAVAAIAGQENKQHFLTIEQAAEMIHNE